MADPELRKNPAPIAAPMPMSWRCRPLRVREGCISAGTLRESVVSVIPLLPQFTAIGQRIEVRLKNRRRCTPATRNIRPGSAGDRLASRCLQLWKFVLQSQVTLPGDPQYSRGHPSGYLHSSGFDCGLGCFQGVAPLLPNALFPEPLSRPVGFLGSSYSWHDPSFGEFPTDLLWSRFQNHIERRFCGTADPRKSTL